MATQHHGTNAAIDSSAPAKADPEAAALEADFTGWHVWRATDRFGQPGDFVATRHDPAAGVDPTVMAGSAAEMRAALTEQRVQRAMRSRRVF